jgi:hypothetical protein
LGYCCGWRWHWHWCCALPRRGLSVVVVPVGSFVGELLWAWLSSFFAFVSWPFVIRTILKIGAEANILLSDQGLPLRFAEIKYSWSLDAAL